MGRLPDARLAWRTGMTSRVMFAVTLALTLTVPLQWAIIGGAVLSLITFVIASASQGDLQVATRDGAGWMLSEDIPQTLSPDEPVVVRHSGPNFFADVSALADRLPAPDPKRPGVLVVDVGALQQLSSTAIKQVAKYHDKLAAAGSGLVLAGIGDQAREVLAETGLIAQARRAERPATRPASRGQPGFRAAAGSRAARGAAGGTTCGTAGGWAWLVVETRCPAARSVPGTHPTATTTSVRLDHHKEEALT